MNKTIVIAMMAIGLAPAVAHAQERAGDAALGALSGAVVLGPVGAVAGAVVGYTAGPDIARAWGLKRSAPRRHDRSTKSAAPAAAGKRVSSAGSTAPAASQRADAARETGKLANPKSENAGGQQGAFPPVQALE